MSFDSSKKQWIFMAAGAAAALAVTLVLLNKRREEEEEEEEKQKKRKKFTGEYDLPPFHWETTVKQIEADSKKVLADAAAVLDACARRDALRSAGSLSAACTMLRHRASPAALGHIPRRQPLR